MEDRIVGGIISSVLGDALGVPVEFEDREYLRDNTWITGIIRA